MLRFARECYDGPPSGFMMRTMLSIPQKCAVDWGLCTALFEPDVILPRLNDNTPLTFYAFMALHESILTRRFEPFIKFQQALPAALEHPIEAVKRRFRTVIEFDKNKHAPIAFQFRDEDEKYVADVIDTFKERNYADVANTLVRLFRDRWLQPLLNERELSSVDAEDQVYLSERNAECFNIGELYKEELAIYNIKAAEYERIKSSIDANSKREHVYNKTIRAHQLKIQYMRKLWIAWYKNETEGFEPFPLYEYMWTPDQEKVLAAIKPLNPSIQRVTFDHLATIMSFDATVSDLTSKGKWPDLRWFRLQTCLTHKEATDTFFDGTAELLEEIAAHARDPSAATSTLISEKIADIEKKLEDSPKYARILAFYDAWCDWGK